VKLDVEKLGKTARVLIDHKGRKGGDLYVG
jgi:hypothetical protein